MGHTKIVDTMIKDGLWDAYNNYHMGTTAENICDIWGITREELDEFAAYLPEEGLTPPSSSGRFEDEIVPVPVKKKKEIVEFKVDEYPEGDTDLESISKLKGAFPVGPEGSSDEVEHTFEPHQASRRTPDKRRAARHRRQRLRHERRRCRHHPGLRRGCGEVRPEAHGQADLAGARAAWIPRSWASAPCPPPVRLWPRPA